MQDTADAYPNDFSNPVKSTKNQDSIPLSAIPAKRLPVEAHLYPIDETEDFHDPFSDLSLFLSKKIKNEVEKHGSSKQWSNKIQTDLLAGILPEFKIKFPKYRLGTSAIRKVWEKVSYYYGKVHTHKEAVHSNGKLNIEFMIKENLRGYPARSSSNLPHYNTAHQLAVKISECIATLDGTRPRLDHLTKVIWAAQKHLLTDLSAQKAKYSNEDYDTFDKFIVKTLLETTAKFPIISQKELRECLRKKLYAFKTLKSQSSPETLYQNLASLLAHKLYPTISIHHLLNEKEKNKVQAFIEQQIEISKLTTTTSAAASRVETSQRILALYPLANSLPKELKKEELKKAIYYVYCKTNNEPAPAQPNIHRSVLAFIQVELHFLKRKEEFSDYAKIEKFVTATCTMAQQLPIWRDDYSDELEIFIWYLYSRKESFLEQERDLLNDEISSFMMDFPKYSFKNTLYKLIEYFKKMKSSLNREDKGEEALIWEDIEHKICEWSVQNDMLCRWIHFDPTTPLLETITTLWNEKGYQEKSINHSQFMQEVFDRFIKKHPYINEQLLRTRISILYKYFWYHDLSDSQEASVDRLVKWHLQDIHYSHKEKSLEDKMIILEHRLSEMLPLTPFSKKNLETMMHSR
jgi:hypothetical protein